MTGQATSSASSNQSALSEAIDSLLASVARLAVARGVAYADIEEQLKSAMVHAATQTMTHVPLHRAVSRISAATGINRREVTRLSQQSEPKRSVVHHSRASDVMARWLTMRAYQNKDGQPRPLPRLGARRSFEALVAGVSRDIHSRSLLDEMVRLKLIEYDPTTDVVSVSADGTVPHGDDDRMLGFLSVNVSDHLNAAIDNVLRRRSHFEQAMFAEGLSDASIEEVRRLIGPKWDKWVQELVPVLRDRVDRDAALEQSQQRRIRIGLYAFDDVPEEPPQRDGPAHLPLRLVRRSQAKKAD
jgi:hypothetical protein